jgi:RNA polymerase sigma factor (sigma-70 family)
MSQPPDEAPGGVNRSARGRQSYEEGHSFEDRVDELYRLLHYKVEHGRLFGGRQVDLFLTGRFGDMTVHRAIECKVGQVKSDHIDSFIAKLRMVRREYPAASGTIVSAVSFTDAVAAQAAQEGIQLTLYRDLAAQLFDGHSYVQALIREIESNERYQKFKYIEPMIGYEAVGDSSPAFEILDEWLPDGEWNQLTLLGDVGTGKSFLSRMFAYRLAIKFLENPLGNPLPIRIDLRNADREFSLEGMILTHLAQNGLGQVNFDIFQYSLAQGNIVLILDGFDEMAARVTPQVTSRNFLELARSVQGRAKVLLTCRTHYFKSRTEEEEVILGGTQDYGSETARALYWELIARKGFKIAYLRPFDTPQIEEYVSRAKPFEATQAMQKIRDTYNLMELSQRPMLLEMIVKSIDKLTAPEINAATLYDVYTSAWIYRDKWRDVLTPDEKLSFLMALSRSLWDEDISGIHYTRLLDYVHQNLASQIQDPQRLVEIDSEVRTASFLTRDQSGHYGFAHKSHGEYFLARYIADQLNSGRVESLHTRRLTTEVIHFLSYMTDHHNVEPLLESILLAPYTPLISENALVCLYGFRRANALNEHSVDDDQPVDEFVVSLPPNMSLKGAQLSQVSLEGAVLAGADFTEANLSEGILRRSDLTGSNLSNANLTKTQLVDATLMSVNARSALMIRANCEGANFVDANMTGVDLTDSYLLKIRYEGAVLSDVVWNGAILPEELRGQVKQLEEDLLKQGLQGVDTHTLNQYWWLIEQLRPFMLRVARLTSLMIHVDAEDIVHDAIVRLSAPPHLERLSKADESGQRDYVYSMMRRMLLSQETKLKREVPYVAELELEEEWIVEDELMEDDEEGESAGSEDSTDDESSDLEDPLYNIPLVSVEELDRSDLELSETDFEEGIQAFARADAQLAEKILSLEMRKVLSERVWRMVSENYIEGFTLEDIAAREGMTVSNVKNIIDTARNVLREHFADRATSN